MQMFPLSDPRSFGIPVLASGLIITLVMVLLSTKWMNSEPVITKVPKHINARLVQVKKAVPKKTIKKPKKKPVAKKAIAKKNVVKPKKVVVDKKKAKKIPIKKVAPTKPKPAPKPLPDRKSVV